MVLLVPRQLRMTNVTGKVPYYGGRLSPAQAYAASHQQQAAPPPPPRPSVPDPQERIRMLDELLESRVVTDEEYQQLRERLEA